MTAAVTTQVKGDVTILYPKKRISNNKDDSIPCMIVSIDKNVFIIKLFYDKENMMNSFMICVLVLVIYCLLMSFIFSKLQRKSEKWITDRNSLIANLFASRGYTVVCIHDLSMFNDMLYTVIPLNQLEGLMSAYDELITYKIEEVKSKTDNTIFWDYQIWIDKSKIKTWMTPREFKHLIKNVNQESLKNKNFSIYTFLDNAPMRDCNGNKISRSHLSLSD